MSSVRAPRVPRKLVPLCFIEPQDAIRVIADSVGREARRQLVDEVLHAWIDDLPEQELSSHYLQAIADLDQEDLHLLAAWHASLEVGQSEASGRTAARHSRSLFASRARRPRASASPSSRRSRSSCRACLERGRWSSRTSASGSTLGTAWAR
jgi:hypothetical protein